LSTIIIRILPSPPRTEYAVTFPAPEAEVRTNRPGAQQVDHQEAVEDRLGVSIPAARSAAEAAQSGV
jgi:hypothetical protein